jgi:CxxC-x17-CxxC domain-containing protein
MAYEDKQLTCVDCGTTFAFTGAEQEKFAQLGFQNEPKRCGPCRAAKKASGGGGRGGGGYGGGGGGYGGGGGGRREMFSVVCSECGKPAQVPFKPRGDRPVYCSDCFGKRSGGR